MMPVVFSSRVLVVDDEPRIRDVVRYALEREGYRVSTADDLRAATRHLETETVDLVVLDVMLPDGSGLELCRRLRSRTNTPILFLSARSEAIDRVIGLEVGGDDYLPKPFSPRELVARVRAVLRRANATLEGRVARDGASTPTPRTSAPPAERPLGGAQPAVVGNQATAGRGPGAQGPLVVDVQRHEVRVNGRSVRLTATEFSILASLAARPGVVLSRQQLLDAAVGDGVHVAERTVDTHVRRIRNKLREQGIAPIETVHGVGYKLREEP
jgi:two-component system OmpR family response regulator